MREWICPTAAVYTTAIILLLFISCAFGHETKTGWVYDSNCCSNMHCHPVADDVVEDKKDGVWVNGFGMMSYGDPRLRWSGDNQDHLCISSGKLLCVYRRPRDM